MKVMILVLSSKESCNLLNGDLSVLIRKKFPKDYVGWVYTYVAKNSKKGLVHHIKCAYNDYGWDEDFVEFEEIPIDKVWPGCELNGKVVARFWCDKVERLYEYQVDGYGSEYEIASDTLKQEELLKECCLTYDQLSDYLGDINNGYAIHITKLEIFNKPKEISEFIFLKKNVVIDGVKNLFYATRLTRAPRSGWCYIEEK